MSVLDEPESAKAIRGAIPDTKADEEERYRLKIIALEECYNSVQLQTFRLRERIYNVRKQCRRLEGMKRAALNLLRYYTGTYDIPPLEIVDEDPVPSFLESLQKQQVSTPETPRKKAKRPCRSKSDGKLTPEEEERAKQKICSIIDSVYSETARRMGDTPKRSIRSLNPETLLNNVNDGVPKTGRNLFLSEIKKRDEGKLKEDKMNTSMENFDDEDNQSDIATMQLGGHYETAGMDDEELETTAITTYNDSISNHCHDSVFNQRFSPPQSIVCDGEAKTNQSIGCHGMATSLYNGVPAYSDSTHQVRGIGYDGELVNNPFTASLDVVNYSGTSSTDESNTFFGNDGQLLVSCSSLNEVMENTVIYTNAANCADSSVSVKTLNCNENVNPSNVLDYETVLSGVQAMNDAAVTGPEPNYPGHPNTPLTYEDVVTTLAEIVNVNEMVSSEVVGAEDSEGAEQARSESPFPIKKCTDGVPVRAGKQEMQNLSSNDKTPNLPLPNFIPYRMITVENPKPTEVIMADPSGGEIPESKQLPPRRRRKYKYVVESVLDNVPYTFRQAESDDDESYDRNSSPTTNTNFN